MVTTAIRTLGGHAKRRLPGRATVLAYHRVASPAHDPWHLAVTPGHFDGHLGELGRIGRVDVPRRGADHAVLRRVGGTRRPFAITFDDGYVDNLDKAVPILERHDTPATIFIATGMLDEPSFWWDVLGRLGARQRDARPLLPRRVPRAACSTTARPANCPADDRRGLHDALYPAVIHARSLRSGRSSASCPPRRYLAARSRRPAGDDGRVGRARHPSAGLHRNPHRQPPPSDPAPSPPARPRRSRRRAPPHQLLGAHRRVLAYPFGETSPAIAGSPRSAGITHAVTTDARWVGPREDPMLILGSTRTTTDATIFGQWVSPGPERRLPAVRLHHARRMDEGCTRHADRTAPHAVSSATEPVQEGDGGEHVAVRRRPRSRSRAKASATCAERSDG